VADRGYFNGEEILVCEHMGIAVTLPKPMTFGAMAEGRFGKQDFVYNPDDDVYRCPTGETLKYYYTNVEDGLALSRYWTNAGWACHFKSRCTPAQAALPTGILNEFYFSSPVSAEASFPGTSVQQDLHKRFKLPDAVNVKSRGLGRTSFVLESWNSAAACYCVRGQKNSICPTSDIFSV